MMRMSVRCMFRFFVGLAVIAGNVSCMAQSGQAPTLRISAVMTQRELRDTGVSGLSAAQRVALDQWLTRYTASVLTVRSTIETGHQSVGYAPGKGHWVSEVSNNGAIVTLEDGSMWDIETIDQIDTALWLPVTDITVIANPRPIGDYKYILINTEDDEKATARFLGRH